MTWPTGSVNTANTDASTDSPANARADFLDLEQKVNQIIAHGAPVLQAGTQTIDGSKTFSSSPSVPAGSTAGQAVNKGQMDVAISTATPNASTLARGLVVLASAASAQNGSSTTEVVTSDALAKTMLGGAGQAWLDVTASRSIGGAGAWTNNTGRPICVSVTLFATSASWSATLSVSGIQADYVSQGNASAQYTTLKGVVPHGATYGVVAVNASLNRWTEMR